MPGWGEMQGQRQFLSFTQITTKIDTLKKGTNIQDSIEFFKTIPLHKLFNTQGGIGTFWKKINLLSSLREIFFFDKLVTKTINYDSIALK